MGTRTIRPAAREGIMKYTENESYEGTWHHGKKLHGKFTMSDGSYYVGEFEDDEWHGLGLLVNEEELEFWYEGQKTVSLTVAESSTQIRVTLQ